MRLTGTTWAVYEATGIDYVPMERWGKDHWSTFAYLETVAVDARGRVENSRMRCHPRRHRAFVGISPLGGPISGGDRYPTILRDGELPGHDDWSCLEDMVAAGLIRAWWRVRDRVRLVGHAEAHIELTDRGKAIAAALRQHKMDGGVFATFTPPPGV